MKKLIQAILLKKINYSETSLVLHFYTLENGFQSFLYPGARKKKTTHPFHALSIVEIECFYRKDSELGKITAINNRYTFQEIPFNPYKSGVAFFVAEVCNQCLKENEKDPATFYFLEGMISSLDQQELIADYPLIFLIQLTKYLGFTPQVIADQPNCLDCREGEILKGRPPHSDYIEDETITLLANALTSAVVNIRVHKTLRRKLLHNLLHYYRFHVEGFKTPKSLNVLETIFS